jgi:hypothetical protein
MLMVTGVQTPVEAVEKLFADLVSGQVGAGGRELQAATTLLLVALSHFRARGGQNWQALLDEYIAVAKGEPERLERMLDGNRSLPELRRGR